MCKLFRQFSFSGGIHEGGELGYALSHAYGAVFDNPDLIVSCVVGDGEAETGPLATGWQGNNFLNPARNGCVLPILHLNGYKIANPCFLASIPRGWLSAGWVRAGQKTVATLRSLTMPVPPSAYRWPNGCGSVIYFPRGRGLPDLMATANTRTPGQALLPKEFRLRR